MKLNCTIKGLDIEATLVQESWFFRTFWPKHYVAAVLPGLQIHTRYPLVDPGTEEVLDVPLLLHELAHCYQVVRAGGYGRFLGQYLWGWAKNRFQYAGHPMEVEATILGVEMFEKVPIDRG